MTQEKKEDPPGKKAQDGMKVPVVKLPYVHPFIKVSDLSENLKLYSDSDIQSIRDLNLPEGRIKSTTLQQHGIANAEWDVIKKGSNYYAVYRRGYEAGSLLVIFLRLSS